MEHSEFIGRLTRLSAGEIAALAARVCARHDNVDDDVAWWNATVAVDRSLRQHGASSRSALVAGAAEHAVVEAARRAKLDPSAPEVVAVARAAADLARALVAGEPSADACYFFDGWGAVLPPPPGAPCMALVPA